MVFAFFVSIISCEKEKSKKDESKTEVESYIIDSKNSVINWTAYKTTDKIPVKGVFEEVNIVGNKSASNKEDLLKGLEFEIPVGSINSNDTIRDFKLVKFFFEVMENTISLKGKFISLENGKGKVELSMNGISNELQFTYEVNDETISVNSVLNLDNWKVQPAIESLNKVCNEKHKGADGISKTWSEVAIMVEIKTLLEK
jgi:hypothetical protein